MCRAVSATAARLFCGQQWLHNWASSQEMTTSEIVGPRHRKLHLEMYTATCKGLPKFGQSGHHQLKHENWLSSLCYVGVSRLTVIAGADSCLTCEESSTMSFGVVLVCLKDSARSQSEASCQWLLHINLHIRHENMPAGIMSACILDHSFHPRQQCQQVFCSENRWSGDD